MLLGLMPGSTQGGEPLQLDLTFCADTQETNLPRDREGYDRFETTHEKLSTKRIHWGGVKFYIFFFGELFLKIDENDLKKIAMHSWMHLVESSNTEVSGASEVTQSRG